MEEGKLAPTMEEGSSARGHGGGKVVPVMEEGSFAYGHEDSAGHGGGKVAPVMEGPATGGLLSHYC
jgi:hypothetical protein